MRRAFVSFAAFVLAILPVGASAACAHADSSLAGHYYLHGVMEVGSELLLRADGGFEYMLAYGALDELASGCWTRNGGGVTLNAHKFDASMEDPRKFTRLELTIASGGKLIRHFDTEHVGAYTRKLNGRRPGFALLQRGKPPEPGVTTGENASVMKNDFRGSAPLRLGQWGRRLPY